MSVEEDSDVSEYEDDPDYVYGKLLCGKLLWLW